MCESHNKLLPIILYFYCVSLFTDKVAELAASDFGEFFPIFFGTLGAGLLLLIPWLCSLCSKLFFTNSGMLRSLYLVDVRDEVERGEGSCWTRCNEARKLQCHDGIVCLHAIALTTALHTLMKKHQ